MAIENGTLGPASHFTMWMARDMVLSDAERFDISVSIEIFEYLSAGLCG